MGMGLHMLSLPPPFLAYCRSSLFWVSEDILRDVFFCQPPPFHAMNIVSVMVSEIVSIVNMQV